MKKPGWRPTRYHQRLNRIQVDIHLRPGIPRHRVSPSRATSISERRNRRPELTANTTLSSHRQGCLFTVTSTITRCYTNVTTQTTRESEGP